VFPFRNLMLENVLKEEADGNKPGVMVRINL